MNESHIARKIKDVLDAGLGLTPEASARLRVARERALERHRAPVAVSATAGASTGGGSGRTGVLIGGSPHQLLTRIVLPAAILVAAAFGLQQWQDTQRAARSLAQQVAEIEEIDSGLLTGDLPIKAYLDEDFQAWLKRSAE